MLRTGLHLKHTHHKEAKRRFLHPCTKTGTCPSKAKVPHFVYKALAAVATSLYLPCSRAGLSSFRWGRLMISSLPFPPQPKLAEILQEQCPKPPDYPMRDGEMTLSSCSRNKPALQNRHRLKSRTGMGNREALPVRTGTRQWESGTGPSSENNWSKHQLIKCTKGPGGRQHILDSTLPHFQPSFKRRKQQRHVQSHGHAFGEFQECLKELQQQNIQLLHLRLNCILSWSLL